LPDALFCPACGVTLPPGASYCRECGTHLTVRDMPAVPAPPPAADRLPTPEPLAAIPTPPRAPEPPAPPEPEENKRPGFVTYLGEPVYRRPQDAPKPEPEPVAAPEAPTAELAPQIAPPPRRLEPIAPENDSIELAAVKPPDPPKPLDPADFDDGIDLPRVIVAVLGGLALLAVIIVALVLVFGGKKDKPATPVEKAAATATASPAATAAAKDPLKAQVIDFDALLKRSAKGRSAAVHGDFKAAIANRSKLLSDLKALDQQATDPQFKAALTSFTAAVRESLRQNRECQSTCPESDLLKVQKLKQQTLDKAQPLLDKFGGGKYTTKDI
jgi:hypothetical protein